MIDLLLDIIIGVPAVLVAAGVVAALVVPLVRTVGDLVHNMTHPNHP